MKFTTFGKVIEVPVKSLVPKPIILFTVDSDELAFIVNEEAFVIVSFVVAELYVNPYPTGIAANNIVIKVFTL
jgi:hypothetical protein